MIPAGLIALGQPLDTRAADPSRDCVDGILPGVVVMPKTGEAAAATLAWAAADRLSVVIRGQGSKAGWGARPAPIDVLLDTGALDRILDHQPGDLTVTVEAGARLHDVNARLAPHGQWLALDPPFADRATIGGLIATNDSGPQRHRFGTPRDLVIGIRLATTDGQLASAGGRVVKNVAGYDLAKIASGSFGSLAAIVSATFKLSPLPEASATIVLDRLGVAELSAVAGVMAASQLEPVAFDVHVGHAAGSPAPEITCLIRFASIAAVVLAEVAHASAQLEAVHHTIRTIQGELEAELWAGHCRKPWDGAGTIVRVAWRPAELGQAVAAVVQCCGAEGFELAGRVGVGAGYLRIGGDNARQQDAVGRLRASGEVGNVVVARAPVELKTSEFVWGSIRRPRILQALKEALDPQGILGAGRGPV
jgi:glycolate oxidase FAD binding subunit